MQAATTYFTHWVLCFWYTFAVKIRWWCTGSRARGILLGWINFRDYSIFINFAAHFFIALRFLSASSRLCCYVYILYCLLWFSSWGYSERELCRAEWWDVCLSYNFFLFSWPLVAGIHWWWKWIDCSAFWDNFSFKCKAISLLFLFWHWWFFIFIFRWIWIWQSKGPLCFLWCFEERDYPFWNLSIIPLFNFRPIIWNYSSIDCWFWWAWVMNSVSLVLFPWLYPSQTSTLAWRELNLNESG